MHGPPAYFTIDWPQSRASVEKLAALEPQIAATGHGIPMHGAELRRQLHELALHFEQQAVPAQGRYVGHPAVTDETGVVSVPPAPESGLPKWVIGAALVGGLGYLLLRDKDKARRGRHVLSEQYARRHRDSYEF